MANQDVAIVKSIANRVTFTPNMMAQDLIDELHTLSVKTPIDGSFGLLVRSIIHKVHTNLQY